MRARASPYITQHISAKKYFIFIGVNFYLLGEIFIFLYTDAEIYNIHGLENYWNTLCESLLRVRAMAVS
jgi:hypothetical protein